MNSVERFLATVERRPVDRPAVWLGMPSAGACERLFAEYGVSNLHALKLAVGDDFYAVDLPFHAPYSDAIYAAFDWYAGAVPDERRTLTSDGCFHDCQTVADTAFFRWPVAAEHVDPVECARAVACAPEDKAALGIVWSAHFQDTCAAFGMETALMNMLEAPELFAAVNDRIVDFYLNANEIFYRAAKGKLHAVLIGNDMGSQRGLMLSPELIRTLVLPGSRRLVEQAHRYGLKVLYHSCGAIAEMIPDLLEMGVDVIHPIQALAAGMSAESLHERFGGRASFCGGVDTQRLLVSGSPEDVRRRVRELRALFPTGLILSPSHEAILPDVPPENLRALFEEATSC